jgi:hypothetical protein
MISKLKKDIGALDQMVNNSSLLNVCGKVNC